MALELIHSHKWVLDNINTFLANVFEERQQGRELATSSYYDTPVTASAMDYIFFLFVYFLYFES